MVEGLGKYIYTSSWEYFNHHLQCVHYTPPKTDMYLPTPPYRQNVTQGYDSRKKEYLVKATVIELTSTSLMKEAWKRNEDD